MLVVMDGGMFLAGNPKEGVEQKIKAIPKKNTQTQLSGESGSQLSHLNHGEKIQDLLDSLMRLPGDGYNGSGRRIDEDAGDDGWRNILGREPEGR
ncbi:hypothetical protein CDAR_548191 [Caerostris darwini]|uniref:Uncharacterized protein n=1 Tax=Caerostris darwini TaxID=1538125 RepID=A0AAV4WFZ9_9ARAC|nr:hypothetical protein CDAR_548191 [Caerostris darwini]